MKRNILCIAALALIACTLSGCITYRVDSFEYRHRNGIVDNIIDSIGVNEERAYEIEEFDKLMIEGNMTNLHIYLTQGDAGLSVECDTAYFDKLNIRVRDGELQVTTNRFMPERVNLYVSAPEFSAIDCRGAAEITSDTQLSGDALMVDVAGAVSGELDLTYNLLDIKIAGAGEMDLRGEVEEAIISCAGACSISARRLTTQIATIDVAGAGSVEIRCERELNTTISGVGSVGYWGDPSVKNTAVALGVVMRRGN